MRALYTDTTGPRAVRQLLGLAFRELTGLPMPPMAKTPLGKPYFPDRPDIHFSLSHGRTHCMAVIGGEPCGCDIELIRPVYPSAPRRVCTEAELAEFDFFELWVLKESAIKLLGGLPCPMDRLNFARRGGRPVCLFETDRPVNCALYDAAPNRAAVLTYAEPPAALEFVPSRLLGGG